MEHALHALDGLATHLRAVRGMLLISMVLQWGILLSVFCS